MYTYIYIYIYIYVLGSSARSARALGPCGHPWALVGRALVIAATCILPSLSHTVYSICEGALTHTSADATCGRGEITKTSIIPLVYMTKRLVAETATPGTPPIRPRTTQAYFRIHIHVLYIYIH